MKRKKASSFINLKKNSFINNNSQLLEKNSISENEVDLNYNNNILGFENNSMISNKSSISSA